MATSKKLSTKEQFRAVVGVAKLTFQTAPGAVLFKLVGAVIDAVLPLVTTYFAARTTTALASAYSGNKTAGHSALIYIILTASFGVIMTIWRSLDSYVQAKMRYVVESRVSNQMFHQFLSLDFWRYDDKDTADLYDRAQKFSQFFAWVFDRVATILSQCIALITTIIALLFVNPAIALFVLAALIPGVWAQFKLSRNQIRHWNENVEVRRSLSLIEWNMLQPRFIAELRLYGMVGYLLKLRNKLRDKDERQRINIERKSIPMRLWADTLEAAAEVGALIWIGLQIIHRKQPIGQFLYIQQVVSRAMSSASSLVSTMSSIDEDIANLFDYQKFMDLPQQLGGGKKLKGAPELIRFENVSFRYPGSKNDVLKHINLEIKQHEHIAIVGENGAGKSTLIKLLTGLYHPTLGQLYLDDTKIQDVDVASWHRQLGVLQQEFIAYGFATARENVRYGDVDAPDDQSRLEAALQAAEATDFVKKLPNGMDSYINTWMEDDEGTKGVDLSGGQWQRLALARDFYRHSPIVILDEPTSAIDALAEARIFNRLFTQQQRTVITISHRLSTIKKAGTIYMLKDGEIVETGTHDELIAKKGEFYHMFESQIRG